MYEVHITIQFEGDHCDVSMVREITIIKMMYHLIFINKFDLS